MIEWGWKFNRMLQVMRAKRLSGNYRICKTAIPTQLDNFQDWLNTSVTYMTKICLSDLHTQEVIQFIESFLVIYSHSMHSDVCALMFGVIALQANDCKFCFSGLKPLSNCDNFLRKFNWISIGRYRNGREHHRSVSLFLCKQAKKCENNIIFDLRWIYIIFTCITLNLENSIIVVALCAWALLNIELLHRVRY